MSFRRLFLGVLMGSVALVVSYYVLFPHVWYCQWIGFSSFRKVSSHLYVSPKMPPIAIQKAEQAIKEARKRIGRLWGKPVGNPILILCESTDEYRQYCHSDEGAGCSIGTPWNASFIILNLDGLNVDVIAHEMCHDELFSHLGWWTTTREIPQWFNEGLALMVDYRFVATADSIQRYLDYKEACLSISNGGQMVLTLNEISSIKGFFSGNNSRVMLAYMTAGTEVSRWLVNNGSQQVPILINRIKSGESFARVYETLAKKKPPP